MEPYSQKGLLVVLLLHLNQAQDAAPPSSNPGPGPPSLGDVIDGVKAAFELVVKTTEDGAELEVFRQAVEELVPPKDIALLSPAVEDATGDVLAVVVHEHEASEHTGQEQADPMLATSEPMLAKTVGEAVKEQVGLVGEPAKKHVELVENLVQEPKQAVAESAENAEQSVKKPIIEPVELIQKPAEESVKESGDLVTELIEQDPKIDLRDEQEDWSPSKSNESLVQVEPSNSAGDGGTQGKGREEQAGKDERKQKQRIIAGEAGNSAQEQETLEISRAGETDREKEEVEDSKVRADRELQKGEPDEKLPEMAQRPGQDQKYGQASDMSPEGDFMVTTKVEEDGEDEKKRDLIGSKTEGEHVDRGTTAEWMAVGEVEIKALIQNTSMVQKTPNEPATLEVGWSTETPAIVMDANGREWEPPQASNTMDDVIHETNIMNDIITSRDPVLGHVKPVWNTLGFGEVTKALPPFPTLGLEPEDSGEMEENPTDNTQSSSSGQEAWKTGVIVSAFFLLLQIIITVVYILKCKRKPNSGTVPEKPCEEGRGGVKYDVANTDTTIPAEEPTAMADLLEESQVQQETVAMTTLQTYTTAKNSS